MLIEIEYLEKDCTCPKILCLAPEYYFNPLEVGETYENDAIPRYAFAEDYLHIPTNKLIWTKLKISGTSQDKVITTNYYNNGNDTMRHREDKDDYQEIIHSTNIQTDATHIIRTHKRNKEDCWKVNTNVIIYDMEDGTQKEVNFLKLEEEII